MRVRFLKEIFLAFVILSVGWPALGLAQTPDATPPASIPPPPDPAAGVECSDYVSPEERSDPEKLVVRGVACFEKGEYIVALRHYREATRLSESNLLNAALGRVFQELGYPFIARQYYRDYLAGKIDDPSSRERIEQRLETVERELANDGTDVDVESSPPGAKVFIVVDESHWEDMGRTPLKLRMSPGQHRFVVQGDGYLTRNETVTVRSGDSPKTVNASLVATDATFGFSGQTIRRAGIVTMAASAPFLAAGGALVVVGSMKKGDAKELPSPRREELLESGGKMQRTGAVIGVLGVTALVTGAVMYVIGIDTPPEQMEEPQSTAAGLRPRIDVGFRTVGATWAF